MTVRLVAGAWHSGLLLPRDTLARAAAEAGDGTLVEVAERFRAYPALEIGWAMPASTAPCRRSRPSTGDWRCGPCSPRAGVRRSCTWSGSRLSLLTPSRGAGIVTLRLSRAGFGRLAAALGRTFTRRDGHPVEAGPGLYGPSLFYEAEGRFSLLTVCNHWNAGSSTRRGFR